MKTESNNNLKCKKCDVEMVDGVAMKEGWTAGIPDFPGQTDTRGQTFSPSGQSQMVNVQKCPQCGYSVQTDFVLGRREPE